MADYACATERCTSISRIDRYTEPASIATDVSRSPLSASLPVVLPQDNAQTYTPQATTLTSLYEQLGAVAAKPSDRGQRLSELVARIGKAFNVDGCALVLPGTAHSIPQAVYWFADAPPLPLKPLKTTLDFFEGWPTDATPLHLSDVETVQSHLNAPFSVSKLPEIWQSIEPLRASFPEARAVVATTMHVQGHMKGVISLMRSRPHTWTQSEIAGLHTVSHQVASTFDQLQAPPLHQQMQYQRVVNQLTLAIHNASDLNAILKLATDGTANALQVQRGMLLRLKHWDSLFRSHAQAQPPKIRVNVACEWLGDTTDGAMVDSLSAGMEPSPSTVAAALNQSFWLSECALCQQAFLYPDRPIALSGNQHFQVEVNQLEATQFAIGREVAAVLNLEALPALLLAPLESQGTILGFLAFQRDQPHVWQPEELELVQLVSAQVSTAMIQTETLRQVQSLVEKRTAELRESLSVQAKLYDRTRYQLDQLRHLNQVRDEFLSTVSHELRTPLTSMTMAIRMLRQVGLSADRSARYLDILEQQCAQETSLINDLLGLQELESNQVAMQPQAIDLKAMLDDLISPFQQKWAVKGLTLETKLPKRSLRLQSDHESLHRILFELLTNAGKYSDPNSCIQLHVTQKRDSAANPIVVTLRNLGQGIAPDELPLIFDKFKRCQGATHNAIQGTGLGLALVKSLVQHLNGTITAASQPTKDAQTHEISFTLTLPQILNDSKLL